MMNVFAICLLLISLVTAGIWSPTPENPNLNQEQNPNMIVKEGHRVVVVEYEKEDGNTKVVISPDSDSYIHSAKDKISETASDVKDKVQETASDVKDKVKDAASGPRELICDAYGKCKHKIASALGRTKDVVSETAHEVSEKVHGVEENVEEAYEKAKDVASDKTQEGIGKAKEIGVGAKDKAKDMAKGTAEKAKGVKDAVKDKTHQGIDKAKEAIGKGAMDKGKDMAKDTAKKTKSFDAVETPKRIGEDIEHNVTRKAEEVASEVKKKASQAGEAVEEAVGTSAVKKGFKEILRFGKGLVSAFIWDILPLKRLDSVLDVIHLMGISSAYGMCLFVSFVSSYVLSRALTKQQFGMVQSRLYPIYHRVLTVCVGIGLLGHLVGQKRRVLSNKLEMFQALDLIAALATVIGNSVFLEPRATKLMFERMKYDKEEGKGRTDDPSHGVAGGFGDPVCMSSAIGAVSTEEEPRERPEIVKMTERLKKLNMFSSFLNMTTLIMLSWHIVYLGHRLQLTR